jgi:hypothetical protein
MTGTDVPHGVRIAAAVAWLMVPAGVLLLLDGLWELRWWGTSAAARLTELMAQIRDQHGIDPPTLLRGRAGAMELVVLGAAGVAFAFLVPLVRRGRRWALTTGLVLALVTFLVGLVAVGTDESVPHKLTDYFTSLTQFAGGAGLAEIRSLLYPGWYSWLEDIAQGLHVLASLAAVLALTYAAIWHSHYFGSKGADSASPDAWDAAISRIREQRQARPDPDQL